MSDVETAKALSGGDFDCALENAIEFGMIEGQRAERARIASILTSDEARSAMGTAIVLALHEGAFAPETVRRILLDVPPVSVQTTNIVDVAARRAAIQLIEGAK